MKVLMISGDLKILEFGTEANIRIERYREKLEVLDVVVFSDRGNRFTRILNAYREGKIFFQKTKYDLITAQGVEHTLVAWKLSKRFDVPWEMQIHTDIFSPHFIKHSVFNKMRWVLAKFLVTRASCVRVVSERIKNSLKSYEIESRKISVLPIFVDMQGIRNSPITVDLHRKYPNKFIILMVSRITKEKNIEMAVKAMRKLKDESKCAGKPLLLIVGDGSEKKNLVALSVKYGLEISVVFEEWIENQKQLYSYYKTADIYLLTSFFEGYGRTVVEAVAAGCPVVMTDVGIAGDIIKNEENGFIVPVGDIVALESAIQRVISDEPLRNRLSESASNISQQYSNFDDYCSQLIESWKQCTKK